MNLKKEKRTDKTREKIERRKKIWHNNTHTHRTAEPGHIIPLKSFIRNGIFWGWPDKMVAD